MQQILRYLFSSVSIWWFDIDIEVWQLNKDIRVLLFFVL